MWNVTVASILGFLCAVAGTVLTLIFIVPAKKRETLPRFLQGVQDFLNFKYLVLEKILKALYLFVTLFCVAAGFFMLFAGMGDIFEGYYYSFAGQGLLLMLLGPIVARVVFEVLMMLVLLVKNTSEINGKMEGEAKPNELFETPDFSFVKPASLAANEEFVFCSQCGTRYRKSDEACPICGKK